MLIQDNLHGALLISAIDFTLSFVIIGGIGVILALFPLINRLAQQDQASRPAMPGQATPPMADSTGAAATTSSAPPAGSAGLHPGLSDQQLVVLMAAAASEILGKPVRIERFRPLNAKDWNWAAQGRSHLHSHRLK